MNEPIKAGDLAEVIGGMLGKESPNLGLVVRVLSYEGDHSQLGPIWRCEAEHAELGQRGSRFTPGTAHFAKDWLRKIDQPPQTNKTVTKKEIEA